MKSGVQALLMGLVALCLSACSPDFDSMAQKRLEYARQNRSDIEIVAVQDIVKSNYLNGVLLAAEEINQRAEKLLGRSLKVNIEQDGETFEATKPIIRRIAANPKITAVLGHRNSNIAVPASVVYERSQIIFIPPFSTAQELTGHNFQYVFRMTPNASIMAEQIASVAKILGYQKIVVLYSRDDLYRELAFLFEDAAVRSTSNNSRIELVQNSSFFEKEENYRPLIAQFSGKTFDAVFIAASPKAGANMVKQLREMGINKPILGSDTFNVADYNETAGNAANNTIIPAVYRPNPKNPINTAFIHNYQKKYQAEPDYNAAQGYDSVMLFAAAVQQAGSTLPPLLSSTLHYMPAWIGVTGLHAFNDSGDLRGKKYIFNVWQYGQLRPLPAIHVPYLLERFEKRLRKAQTTSTNTMNPPPKTTLKADTGVTPASAPAQMPEASKETSVTTDKALKETVKVTPAPSIADKDKPSFAELFSQRLHTDDHKTHLLELAQAILQFRRLGIIYEDTENGRNAASYSIVKSLADKVGVELVGCDIPFSALSRREIELELIACYGKLSLNADALFITPYEGINANLTNELNQSMGFFKVPSIYLGDGQEHANLGLILNKRSDVDPQGRGDMEVYRSLLNNIKVHELAERLQGMPEIAVNLKSLQQQGLADKALLDLSPDAFLENQHSQESKEAKP